jgi:hypothetical protein
MVDINRPNPLSASPRGTIQPVFQRGFHKLLVPYLFENGIEKLVDMLQIDVLISAACWRHLLSVCH